MRKSLFFNLTSPLLFKSQLLQWASQFSNLAFLNSNTTGSENYSTINVNTYDLVVGVDAICELKCSFEGASKQLENFIERINDWCFGYLSYDLKNDVEKTLFSKNQDSLEFPDLHFFQPRLVFMLKETRLEVSFVENNYAESHLQMLIEEINSIDLRNEFIRYNAAEIQAQVSKENYFKNVAAIKKDNFWEMGDTGPCGPCSEIHIDTRSDEEVPPPSGLSLVNNDHPEVIEIWNNVFIQFNRKADGSLEELSAKHVDTGMGFERLCRAIQKKKSNYDTDIFASFIQHLVNKTGIKYTGSFELDAHSDIAYRVLVDHIRAVVFTIADGEMPSNTGAGYVIRRILRRAIRYYYSFFNRNEPLM